MLWAVPVLVTVFLSVPVWGAGPAPSSDSFSLLASLLQMGAALVLVVGLILLIYYGMTRLVPRIPALRVSNRYIRVVEVRSLEPRKSLILVEVAGEYLLLASSDGNLSLIKQVALVEEGEIVTESDTSVPFATMLKRLRQVSGEPDSPPRKN